MILFFDTETTGLPLDYNAPPSDASNWPRIIELSWLLSTDDGEEVESSSDIILPVGFRIPAGATLTHGISDEQARKEGRPLAEVLRRFYLALSQAELIVGHNVEFDIAVIAAEYHRLTIGLLLGKPRVCTMKESTEFCALPRGSFVSGDVKGGRAYKWPKLDELHEALFGESFAGSHRAAADVEATARCYFQLRRKGVIGGGSV